MEHDIFGYTWDQIKHAQQGGRITTGKIDLAAPIEKPKASENDIAQLAEHGVSGLVDKELYGVLDRLSGDAIIDWKYGK